LTKVPKGEKAKEQKAASAAAKAGAESARAAAEEAAAWEEGANTKAAKKAAEEQQRAAERARLKAAADAQLREEAEAAAKQKLRGAEKVAARQAAKALTASDEVDAASAPSLVGRGIDAALAVMTIATSPKPGGSGGEDAGGGGAEGQVRVDRMMEAQVAGLKEDDKHPERRQKAAYQRYRERELPLLKKEFPSLRMSQHVEVRGGGGSPALSGARRAPPLQLPRYSTTAHPRPPASDAGPRVEKVPGKPHRCRGKACQERGRWRRWRRELAPREIKTIAVSLCNAVAPPLRPSSP
jgi:hypothetical protein